MDITLIQIIITLAWFIFFIGICIWAFLPRLRKRFEQDAKLPFTDEDRLKGPLDE